MKTEKDKVKKKVWEKPCLKVLKFNNTRGGGNPLTGEDAYNTTGKS
jgi:hypothetical protein